MNVQEIDDILCDIAGKYEHKAKMLRDAIIVIREEIKE